MAALLPREKRSRFSSAFCFSACLCKLRRVCELEPDGPRDGRGIREPAAECGREDACDGGADGAKDGRDAPKAPAVTEEWGVAEDDVDDEDCSRGLLDDAVV